MLCVLRRRRRQPVPFAAPGPEDGAQRDGERARMNKQATTARIKLIGCLRPPNRRPAHFGPLVCSGQASCRRKRTNKPLARPPLFASRSSSCMDAQPNLLSLPLSFSLAFSFAASWEIPRTNRTPRGEKRAYMKDFFTVHLQFSRNQRLAAPRLFCRPRALGEKPYRAQPDR